MMFYRSSTLLIHRSQAMRIRRSKMNGIFLQLTNRTHTPFTTYRNHMGCFSLRRPLGCGEHGEGDRKIQTSFIPVSYSFLEGSTSLPRQPYENHVYTTHTFPTGRHLQGYHKPNVPNPCGVTPRCFTEPITGPTRLYCGGGAFICKG